jgi:hypothetical protein
MLVHPSALIEIARQRRDDLLAEGDRRALQARQRRSIREFERTTARSSPVVEPRRGVTPVTDAARRR